MDERTCISKNTPCHSENYLRVLGVFVGAEIGVHVFARIHIVGCAVIDCTGQAVERSSRVARSDSSVETVLPQILIDTYGHVIQRRGGGPEVCRPGPGLPGSGGRFEYLGGGHRQTSASIFHKLHIHCRTDPRLYAAASSLGPNAD